MAKDSEKGKDEINSNLGSFGNTVGKQRQIKQEVASTNGDVATVKNDKKPKIDFSKFTKSSNKIKESNKILVFLQKKLESNKNVFIFFISYLLCYFIILGVSITFINVIGYYSSFQVSLNKLSLYANMASSSIILFWISTISLSVPVIILIISWIVGINQVHKSPIFHLLIITIILVIFCILAVALTMSSCYLSDILSFESLPAKPEDDTDSTTTQFIRYLLNA